ncbi:MAG: heavy-metal-associated domain-containing protein [Nanobdellota archaeon]
MKNIKFDVKGMHCSSCEILIKDALEETEGITYSEVSCRDGKALVCYDEKIIDQNKIKNIVKEEGYEVF